MPYNTSSIPPRKEPTGQTQLPVTRVRKIITVDPDIAVCSNNAAFVVTLATELFIQYLASEAHNMVKLDRKPRRNVQYRDLASAVQRVDRLEFLEDVAPATVPFGKVKGEAAAAQAKLKDGAVAPSKSSRADRKSTGGGAPPPTTISSLTNHGSGGRQQQLPFNILNGPSSSSHGGSRSAEGSGVAAAAALAQAAAASSLDDGDDGPDAQLEQDMRRMQGHGPSRGSGNHANGDVEMTDS